MDVNTQPPAAGSRPGGEVTVHGIFGALGRRKSWVILPTLLAFCAAVAFVLVTPPAYRADTTIIVEPQETSFTRPQSSGQNQQPSVDREAVASQVQVVRSIDVANIVIDQLNLDERAEFNPALRPAGIMSIISSILGGGSNKDDERKAVLREYFKHLSVYAVNDTRVISVMFWSRDDELAADAANAVAQAYLTVQRESTAQATTDARSWLETQITDLRTRVEGAERAVETYRAEKGLFASGDSRDESTPAMSLQGRQLSELSTQLTQARAQRSDAQARARMIRQLMDNGQAVQAREVSGSVLIQRLQEERVRRASQIAELSSTLLPAHPRMKELNAQLRNLDRQIEVEVEKIVAGLENDAAVAAAREMQIESSIEGLKSDVAVDNASEVELRALEREAKAQRELLAAYLTRYREAAARSDNEFAPAYARIISRATVPLKPYFPSKTGIPLLATIAAFVVSAGLVITLELASAYSMAPAARNEDYYYAEITRREPVVADAAPAPRTTSPSVDAVPSFDEVEPPAPQVQPEPVSEAPVAVAVATPVAAPREEPVNASEPDDAIADEPKVEPESQPEPEAKKGRGPIAAAMRRAASLLTAGAATDGETQEPMRKEPVVTVPSAAIETAAAVAVPQADAEDADAEAALAAEQVEKAKVVEAQVAEAQGAAEPEQPATQDDAETERASEIAISVLRDDVNMDDVDVEAVEAAAEPQPGLRATIMVITSIGDQSVPFATALIHARQTAAKGQRVIVIDTSEGNPSGADKLRRASGPGYYDVIEGRADLADVMFRDPASSLHVIGAGSSEAAPDIEGHTARMTLDALAKAYDLVVVAAPAVYSATLVPFADEVAVVSPPSVPGELAEEFAQMLADVTDATVDIVEPEPERGEATSDFEDSVA
ncbi:Wzz/FepE/Etk N-terminal domain-containing protein [Tepidamorphus sp. 3E244]|uniref:Wzz/FepE/Etk N-terminal domain-containing protein n=1 Tax=Tepidamorphus sp. 3E244 TaxID=3385498 RepID=UPI0038FC1281